MTRPLHCAQFLRTSHSFHSPAPPTPSSLQKPSMGTAELDEPHSSHAFNMWVKIVSTCITMLPYSSMVRTLWAAAKIVLPPLSRTCLDWDFPPQSGVCFGCQCSHLLQTCILDSGWSREPQGCSWNGSRACRVWTARCSDCLGIYAGRLRCSSYFCSASR